MDYNSTASQLTFVSSATSMYSHVPILLDPFTEATECFRLAIRTHFTLEAVEAELSPQENGRISFEIAGVWVCIHDVNSKLNYTVVVNFAVFTGVHKL